MMIHPMICVESKPFNSPYHLIEEKDDGERGIVIFDGDSIQIQNREGSIVTKRYPELQRIKLEKPCVLDGEIVVMVNGKSRFDLLIQRSHLEKELDIKLRMNKIPVVFRAFDCLFFDGQDIREMTLLKRKDYLYQVMAVNEVGQFNIPLSKEGKGLALFEQARQTGREGIVAKLIESPYLSGESQYWKKSKVIYSIDMIFNSYTINPAGIRVDNGNIAVQVAGKQSREVKETIDRKGKALIEVNFLSITENNKLRQPTFKTLKG